VSESYRRRRIAFARAAAGRRLGSAWTVGGRIAIGLIGLLVSAGVAAILERGAVNTTVLLAGIVGAIAANGIWLSAVYAWSYFAAPSEMDRELRGQLDDAKHAAETHRAGADPDAAIRQINEHLAQHSAVWKRVKPVLNSADVEDWTPALREVVDWIAGAGVLIDSHCVGRKHEFDVMWRRIPSHIREAGRNPDGSPWVDGAGTDVMGWMSATSRVLRGCIGVLEARPR
jgi:hypothetical protein